MRILQLKQAAISPPNPTTRRTERDNLGVTYGAVGFEIAGATSPEGNEALSVGLSLGDFEIRAAIPPQAADEMSVSLELDDFRFQRHPDAQASDAMEVGHLITDFSFKPHPHTQSTDAMAVSLAMTDFEYNGSASLDGLYHVGSTGPSYIESGLTISTPAIPASIEVNQAIFAVVYARSAVTPPAGWTLVDQVAAVDATAGVTQTLYIYRKDTSAPSDGGTAPLWGQSTPGRMGLAYTVVGSTTGFVSIADVAHTTTEVSTDTAYPHTVDVSTMVSESARELFLFAGNAIDGSSSDTTWGKTTGSLKTANTIPHNRLVVGALPASTAAALNTSLTYAPQLPPGKNYYGSIALRLSDLDIDQPLPYKLSEKITSWWEMNEASGTRMDSKGENHLTVAGTVTTAPGVRGRDIAALFAGSGSLNVASNSTLSAPADSAHCLFGWVNLDSVSDYQAVVAKWDAMYSDSLEYAVQLSYATLYAANGGSSYHNAYWSPDVSTGNWMFVVMWKDPETDMLYFSVNDGEPIAVAAAENPPNTSIQLSFGSFNNTYFFLHGKLQRWGWMQGHYLSAEERTWLYNSGQGRTYSELQGGEITEYDPYFKYVTALLKPEPVQGSTTFYDEIGKSWKSQGNARVDTSLGYPVASFDGWYDYIDAIAQSDFGYAANEAWTVDLIAHFDVLPAGSAGLFDMRPQATNGYYPMLYARVDGGLGLYWDSIDVMITAPGIVTTTGEYHLELSRDTTGALRLFCNGILVSTGVVYAGSMPAGRPRLGANGYSASYNNLDGYIRAFRITKGICRHTTNFIPPKAPFPTGYYLDYHPRMVSMLLHGDGIPGGAVVADSSLSAKAVTTHGAAVTTSDAYSKFGTTSLSFGGDSVLLYPYSEDLNLDGDFTIAFWIRPGVRTGKVLGMGGGLNIAWAAYEIVFTGSTINFAGSTANNGYDLGSETSTVIGANGVIGAIATDVWSHVAVTRQGNVYRGFLNGVRGFQFASARPPFKTSPRGLSVGGSYDYNWGVESSRSWMIQGHLDDLIIVKGKALYTENFTVPNAPYTNPGTL